MVLTHRLIENGTLTKQFHYLQKSDSLCKLYDMDDKPERRGWLDNLLGFMEERGKPIAACPTISKQPLDLYKLYMLVKERGGFVEVCKVVLKFNKEIVSFVDLFSLFVYRLPKVKLGKILLVYSVLVLVAVQHIHCENIIRKICLHSNVILIEEALTRAQ